MGAAQKLATPPKPIKYSASLEGLFWINGDGHRIPARWYEYASTQEPFPYFTVLYAPTHDEDLGEVHSKMNLYRELLKVNVLVFDYCGFGLHQCSKPVTEAQYYDTIQSAFNWLITDKGIPSSQIVLLAKGIGTGPVLELAAQYYAKGRTKKRQAIDGIEDKREIGPIVLQSPMFSLNSMISDSQELDDSVPQLKHDVFVNSKKMPNIDSPMLVVHGSEDKFVSFKNFQRLKKLAAKKPMRCTFREIPGKGHHGVDFDDDFLQMLSDFLISQMPTNLAPVHVVSTVVKKPSVYLTPEEVLKSEWLSDLELEHLAILFIQGGYLDLMSMFDLDHETLDGLGITSTAEQTKILDDIFWRKFMPPLSKYVISWGAVQSLEHIPNTDFHRAVVRSRDESHDVSYITMNTLLDRSTFCTEILTLCSLAHPNLVIPQFLCLEAELAICFPWQDLTLQAFTRLFSGQIPDSFLYKVMGDLTTGVEYLHSQDPPIYHGNLYITCVYINGINQPCMIGGWQGRLCRTNSPFPPEFIARQYHPKTDIYSLGFIGLDLALNKKGVNRVQKAIEFLWEDNQLELNEYGRIMLPMFKATLESNPEKRIGLQELSTLIQSKASQFKDNENWSELQSEIEKKKSRGDMSLNLGYLNLTATNSNQEIRRKTVGSPGRKNKHRRGDSTDRSEKIERVDSEELTKTDRRKSAPVVDQK